MLAHKETNTQNTYVRTYVRRTKHVSRIRTYVRTFVRMSVPTTPQGGLLGELWAGCASVVRRIVGVRDEGGHVFVLFVFVDLAPAPIDAMHPLLRQPLVLMTLT